MPKLSRVFDWHENILRYYLILMEFNLRTTFNQFSQKTHAYITAGLAVIWLAYLCTHWVILHVFVVC